MSGRSRRREIRASLGRTLLLGRGTSGAAREITRVSPGIATRDSRRLLRLRPILQEPLELYRIDLPQGVWVFAGELQMGDFDLAPRFPGVRQLDQHAALEGRAQRVVGIRIDLFSVNGQSLERDPHVIGGVGLLAPSGGLLRPKRGLAGDRDAEVERFMAGLERAFDLVGGDLPAFAIVGSNEL